MNPKMVKRAASDKSLDGVDARPHPGLLPQEKEKRSQRLSVAHRGWFTGSIRKFSVVPVGLNLFLHQIPQLKLRAIIGRRFATAKTG
jgi:hypothetical protein